MAGVREQYECENYAQKRAIDEYVDGAGGVMRLQVLRTIHKA